MLMMIWMHTIGQRPPPCPVGPELSLSGAHEMKPTETGRLSEISTSLEACKFSVFRPFFVRFLAK